MNSQQSQKFLSRTGGLKIASLSGCALIALICTPAYAQDAPSPVAQDASESEASDSAEIVVTARARTERLQDVPLAITAIGAEALSDNNVRNLRDVAYLTPGLSIASGGSEFGVNPTIRGQTNLNQGGDPNVAVFLDGIYLSNSTATTIAFADIERVEVVKGPVSALYGRNAFGGVINYVSKKPSTTDMTGKVSAFVGNDQQYSFSASFSYPLITDVLGVRLASGYEHFGGSFKDSVTGQRAGGFTKRNIQLSFLLTPSENFEVSGTGYYGNDEFDQTALGYNINNCGLRAVPPSPLDPSGSGFPAYCGHFDPDENEVEVPILPPNQSVSGNARRIDFASLRASYDFGFAKLISLTGYNKVGQQRYIDFIGRRNGIPFTLSPGPGTVNLIELFGSETNSKDFSQELRLQSSPDKPFRWQIGGFYFRGKQYAQTIIGLDSTKLPPGQTLAPGITQNSLTAPGTLSSLIRGQVRANDRQYSGFVNLEYDLTDRLTASGEYRLTTQKRDQLVIRSTGCPGNLVAPTASCTGPAPTPYLFPNGPNPVSGKFDYDNYRGTLKYEVSSGTNIYASIANGTKAGGFNQRAVAAADGSQPDLEFQPEENVTYEIGIKNSFFDNRLQLNFAAYHIDVTGIQIQGPSSVPTNPGTVIKNFGSVSTDGFEIELAARVADGVRITAGVAYSDPEFGRDAFDFGAANACATFDPLTNTFIPRIASCAGRVVRLAPNSEFNVSNNARNALSLDGLSAPRQPDLQLNFGLDLEGEINADWKWNSNFTARYESKQFGFNNNISWYGPRTVVNVRAGVENETYSASLYVNNLTNDRTPEGLSLNARLSDFGSDLIGNLPIGRQFGLMVGAKF